MRNLEKKSLLPIYQGLLAFQRSKIEEIQELEPFTSIIGGATVTSGKNQLTSGWKS